MSGRHVHVAAHVPPSGTGVGVCECGATARHERGVVVEVWHACQLCVISFDASDESGGRNADPPEDLRVREIPT